MRQWPVWTLRPAARWYWLVVDVVAGALSCYLLVTGSPPDELALARFTAIAVAAGVVIIGTALAMRRRGEPPRNLWALHVCYLLTGVFLLPPSLLVLLLLGTMLHAVLAAAPPPHKWIFSTAAMTLATFLSRLSIGWSQPRTDIASFIVAAATLPLARAAIVAVGFRLRAPGAPTGAVLGDPIDLSVGAVAASLGGMIALSIATEPVHAVLAVAPMVLLERSAQLPHWRRSAQRDAKTGLLNAVHWDRTARADLARMASRRLPTAVLLLDLDRFKRVNDEVGHLAGDSALHAVADLLRTSVRRGDVVGRFGGEEFVVLLPNAAPDEAESVAQRVRLGVAALEINTTSAAGLPHRLTGLTVSIGVATSLRYGYALDELLSAADAALLHAKGAGRNLVTMA